MKGIKEPFNRKLDREDYFESSLRFLAADTRGGINRADMKDFDMIREHASYDEATEDLNRYVDKFRRSGSAISDFLYFKK